MYAPQEAVTVIRMRRYSLYPHLSHGMDSCVPESEENVCLSKSSDLIVVSQYRAFKLYLHSGSWRGSAVPAENVCLMHHSVRKLLSGTY